jgi:hypothetical protein
VRVASPVKTLPKPGTLSECEAERLVPSMYVWTTLDHIGSGLSKSGITVKGPDINGERSDTVVTGRMTSRRADWQRVGMGQ